MESSCAIITSLDPPQCSFFSPDYGVLVLSGERHDGAKKKERIIPDVTSLSILRRRHHHHLDGYKAVPVFTTNDDPLYKAVHRVRGLKQRLEQQVLETKSSSTSNADANAPLLVFAEQCDCLFREVLASLRLRNQQEPSSDKKEEKQEITASYVKWLMSELTALETKYGSSSFELSDDCTYLILQFQDGSSRVHTVRLNLTDSNSLEDSILSYFPPDKEERTEEEETAVAGRKRAHTDISSENTLADLYRQFCERIERYQDVYKELDDLDSNLVVLDPPLPCSRKHLYRRIKVTETVSVIITLAVQNPRNFPALKWIGQDANSWQNKLAAGKWEEHRSVRDNLEHCLGIQLARPHEKETSNATVSPGKDCAICFSDELVDEETGKTEHPDVICENESCGRFYHRLCLNEWLGSLPSSRVSFDRIIGTCPYCKQVISVEMLVS